MAKQSGANRSARTRNRPTVVRHKPSIIQRLRRQELILLTGLVALACVSVITVGLLILRFQSAWAGPAAAPAEAPQPAPVHTVTYVEVTGLSQYRPAAQAAQTWADDAYLISASTHWPQVLNIGQVGEPGEWSYRFYSPAKEGLLLVKVKPDGQVQPIEHVVKITVPPARLEIDDWLVDSPAALARWLDYGGAGLVQRNPGLEVLIQLRSIGNKPAPIWMVVGSDQRTQDLLMALVDANEGKIIPANPGR
jgi:hypothetical protein